MKLKKGDFVLIRIPCSGYSDNADLGPHLVKVEKFSCDGISYRRYISFDNIQNQSCGLGDALYGDIIAKIDDRDVKVLFREGL